MTPRNSVVDKIDVGPVQWPPIWANGKGVARPMSRTVSQCAAALSSPKSNFTLAERFAVSKGILQEPQAKLANKQVTNK